ncbi:flagellar export chaperone FliS [Halalkalibacillus halophilus]|uniref:flagellar export chaperone FliS n=1 Tax=Halalkalibacillus halophilus TaxID=392827 RepID=UPI0004205649|nr:flagellar export chaperone FliS [Halalkalibacillus halophilus]
MAYGQAYQAYQENSISTASPEQLTLQLYNGCIKFIKLSKRAIENESIEEKNINIQKAQNIISELRATLNMDYDISHQLMPLYEYINHRLTQANFKSDVSMLNEAQQMVEQFRDTWKEVMKANRVQSQKAGVQ